MTKRSNMLKLSMMSLVPFSMVACSPIPDSDSIANETTRPKAPTVYETVDLCQEDGNPLQECRKAFEAAQQNAKLYGPKFVTEVDCKAEYAFCEAQKEVSQQTEAATASAPVVATSTTAPQPQHAGGGVFMPMMAGFMLSNALNSSSSMGAAPSAGFAGAGSSRKEDERRSGGGSAAIYRSASGGYAVANPNNGGKAVSIGSVRSLNKANVGEYRAQKAKAAEARAASASRARASRSAGFGSSRSFGG